MELAKLVEKNREAMVRTLRGAVRIKSVQEEALPGKPFGQGPARCLAYMLEEAERLLDTDQYYYLMCTIHPDNQFSRHNMEIHGYEVKRTALCYGGLPRCILLKDLTESGKSPAQVVKSNKQ